MVRGVVDDAAGHQIRPGLPRNDKGAAFQLAQLAVLAAGAFGEDEHAGALFAVLGDLVDGLHIPMAPVDGHGAHAAQEPPDEGIAEKLLLGQDAEASEPEHHHQDEDRVQI